MIGDVPIAPEPDMKSGTELDRLCGMALDGLLKSSIHGNIYEKAKVFLLAKDRRSMLRVDCLFKRKRFG
jgi:hypothetical protein